MKKFIALFIAAFLVFSLVSAFSFSTLAADESVPEQVETAEQADVTGKALSAALVVGIAAALGAISMGFTIAKSVEAMARQPEASGKINSAMMLGLVFIETLIIYALIVAILIIFVM